MKGQISRIFTFLPKKTKGGVKDNSTALKNSSSTWQEYEENDKIPMDLEQNMENYPKRLLTINDVNTVAETNA